MTTFANWLAGSENGPQDDPVAWLARQWKALEGNRPRVSSPTGIEKHLVTLAPPGNAEGDQWTGYVHQAVAEATGRYRSDKAREQLGESPVSGPLTPSASPAGTGEVQDPMPGMNAATGKPEAVVPSGAWVTHPDASQFGSCSIEGWARGLAHTGKPGDSPMKIMCAAGHVFDPERPENWAEADETQRALSELPADAAGTAIEQSDRSEPEPQFDGALPPDIPETPEQARQYQLDRIELMLCGLLAALGLPTDLAALDGWLQAATGAGVNAPDPETTDGLLMQQLADAGVTGYTPPSAPPPTVEQGVPWSFAAWYGMADPAGDTDG
jgi:hypothetical protein